MLTAPQQKFCEIFVLEGNAAGAYREAFGIPAEQRIGSEASRLLKRPEIQAEIERLRPPPATKMAGIMSVTRKRELLSIIAEDVTEKAEVRMRAMELDAKLASEAARDKAADKQTGAMDDLAEALQIIQEATHGRRAD